MLALNVHERSNPQSQVDLLDNLDPKKQDEHRFDSAILGMFTLTRAATGPEFTVAIEEFDKLDRQLDAKFEVWDQPSYRPQKWHAKEFTDGAQDQVESFIIPM